MNAWMKHYKRGRGIFDWEICFVVKTRSIQESSLVVGESGFIHSVVKCAKHSRVGNLFWDKIFPPLFCL